MCVAIPINEKKRPLIQRTFAWGIEQVMRVYEPLIAPRKQELFKDLRGKVVEIGPGTGPNLKYFPKEISWIGIEPNPHMHKYLRREADRVGIAVDLLEASALDIPLEDNSVDFVVGSLVLCSVPCPDTTLKEVLRILKPGGRYLFVEHVAATPGTFGALIQRFIKPIWCCCADGCNVDRQSWVPIRKAGFSREEIEHFMLKFPIVSPHIIGSAVK